MQVAAWAWMPIVLGAAFAQTIRNAAQRTLTQQVGTLPATLVRFLYGLPFAVAWLGLLWLLDTHSARPTLGASYFAWLVLGAVAQLGATALLLMAMKQRNFIVAVAFSKTEVLQVILFGTLCLHEQPGWVAVVAMLLATCGVVLLSAPKADATGGFGSWWSTAGLLGLVSGTLFAFSAVGYRGAALAQPLVSPWLIGAWGMGHGA